MNIALTYKETAEILEIEETSLRSLVSRKTLTSPFKGMILADEKLCNRIGIEAYNKLIASRTIEVREPDFNTFIEEIALNKDYLSYYSDKGHGVYVSESCAYIASIIVATVAVRTKQDAQTYGFKGVIELREAVMEHLNNYELTYTEDRHYIKKRLHNFNVSNVRAFYMHKLSHFIDLGPVYTYERLCKSASWCKALDSLPSKKLNNTNAAYPSWHHDLIIDIYSGKYYKIKDLGAKPAPYLVYDLYTHILDELWEEMQAEGVCERPKDHNPMTLGNAYNILGNMQVKALVSATRHGKNIERNLYKPHFHRDKPAPFAVLTGDGVALGRLTRTESDKSSQKVYVWIWRDWATGASIGWDYGYGESHELIFGALAKVFLRFGSLPKVIQLDDKVSKKPEVIAFCERLGIKIMGKEHYNPQGLYAESGNKKLNQHQRAIDPYWVNITNKSEEFRRKAEDMQQVSSQRIRPYSETIETINKLITFQNGTPSQVLKGKTPLESLSEALPSIQRNELDRRWAAYYFGKSLGKERVTSVNRGKFYLTPEASGEQYVYILKCYAEELPQNSTSFKVRVCWFDEGKEVYVFKVGVPTRKNDKVLDRFLEICTERELYNPDPLTQTEEDKRIQADQAKQIAYFEREKTAFETKIAENLEEKGLDVPALLQKAATKRVQKRVAAGDIEKVFPAKLTEAIAVETEDRSDEWDAFRTQWNGGNPLLD
jgi:hypothetical protein